jgi:hypothetical protein
MSKIHFTDHANERMVERKVSLDAIKATIHYGHVIGKRSKSTTVAITGRTIRQAQDQAQDTASIIRFLGTYVVYRIMENNDFLIITAWDDKDGQHKKRNRKRQRGGKHKAVSYNRVSYNRARDKKYRNCLDI